MRFYIKSLFIIYLLSLISACSSSGGGGPTAATISADNSQDLAIAATESAKQAVTTDSASIFKTSSNINTQNLIAGKIREIAFEATTFPNICTGGGGFTENITESSTSASGSITFTECNIGDGIIINGVVTFSGNQNGFTLTYSNFTVTGFGVSQTISATISCTTTSGSISCNTRTSITGIDGRTYAVSNVNVSGNASSGYTVSASVTDPDHGTITINATNVMFNCSSPNAGRPSSGSITFTSGGQSGSVTFNSCSSYTVTFNGLAELYNW